MSNCCILKGEANKPRLLLNNHHQDGKGKGAIERVQDVAAIRRAAVVDVLAIKGVEDIAAV